MKLGDFRIITQVSAGIDGVAYRASQDDTIVEVRDLRLARDDQGRWPGLVKRIRTAALIDHPASLRIISFDDSNDPPLLVVESFESRTLATAFDDRVPIAEIKAVGIARAISGAVADAHRLRLRVERHRQRTIAWCDRGNSWCAWCCARRGRSRRRCRTVANNIDCLDLDVI